MQDDFRLVARLPIAQPIRVFHRFGQRLELLLDVEDWSRAIPCRCAGYEPRPRGTQRDARAGGSSRSRPATRRRRRQDLWSHVHLPFVPAVRAPQGEVEEIGPRGRPEPVEGLRQRVHSSVPECEHGPTQRGDRFGRLTRLELDGVAFEYAAWDIREVPAVPAHGATSSW
jgi:hypothetical protein